MAAAPTGFGGLVCEDLARALRALGVVSPNSIQADAIPLALSGRDVMTVAQTGSGKTLVFLLPILQRLCEEAAAAAAEVPAGAGGGEAACWPSALVLAPTADLAHQIAQVASRLCAGCGLAGAVLAVGDVGAEAAPKARVAVGTPDGLLEGVARGALRLGRVRTVAIDEADSVLLESGHSCCQAEADDLLRRLEEQPEPPQVLLTMAHLRSDREDALVRRFPALQQVRHTGVLVPTLRQVHHYYRGDRGAKLLFVLKEALADEFLSGGGTLVFCATPQDVEDVLALLEDKLPSCLPRALHSGTEPQARAEALRDFRGGRVRLLATTDAAARGLDLPNLRHVVMWDVPPDTTAWVHVAGRTARRGQEGLVTCLVHADQQRKYQWDFQNHHALKPAEQLRFETEGFAEGG